MRHHPLGLVHYLPSLSSYSALYSTSSGIAVHALVMRILSSILSPPLAIYLVGSTRHPHHPHRTPSYVGVPPVRARIPNYTV